MCATFLITALLLLINQQGGRVIQCLDNMSLFNKLPSRQPQILIRVPIQHFFSSIFLDLRSSDNISGFWTLSCIFKKILLQSD